MDDESDESTVARVVDAAATRPVAHGRIHHKTRGQFLINVAVSAHLTDDPPGEHHIAAPREGVAPDGLAEPRWRGRVGGHALVALRSKKSHVEGGSLAVSHDAAGLLCSAVTPNRR
jgi:hypothetical protein